MGLVATLAKRTFHFSFRARTSRGSMTEKDSWFVKISDSEKPLATGIGEAGPLPGLSPELENGFEDHLQSLVNKFNDAQLNPDRLKGASLRAVDHLLQEIVPGIQLSSAVFFAFETALLDLAHGGTRTIFKNKFSEGEALPINGLIWMGGIDMMLQQIEIKIQEGYNCLKLKVGGIDFEKECDILQYIRRKYFRSDITIRLDANGAFKPEDVQYKLHELSKFNVHSIEQPVKAGSDQLAEICSRSPIPVALDEELIGITDGAQMEELISRIKPQFIVLKPSLHGGLGGCKKWIEIAESERVGWWITSALESSIGLNAIAQFTSEFDIKTPQGLGTGQIYSDNFDSPLEAKKGLLRLNPQVVWEIGSI